MGKCGFRANPDRRGVFSNTKMYFQTAGMYFQTLPIVISHTRLAPGAYYRRVYCPESRKREAKNERVRIINYQEKGISPIESTCFLCKIVLVLSNITKDNQNISLAVFIALHIKLFFTWCDVKKEITICFFCLAKVSTLSTFFVEGMKIFLVRFLILYPSH